MFEKVLVVEDHEIMNLSLRRTLEDMQLPRPDHAYDCNIAIAMLTKALQTGQSYDLLVTDLYFELEGSAEQLPEGEKLIRSARELQPDLKILVLSAESRASIIRRLFDQLHINGYVRGDSDESDHSILGQADHLFHGKLTRVFRAKVTTVIV